MSMSQDEIREKVQKALQNYVNTERNEDSKSAKCVVSVKNSEKRGFLKIEFGSTITETPFGNSVLLTPDLTHDQILKQQENGIRYLEQLKIPFISSKLEYEFILSVKIKDLTDEKIKKMEAGPKSHSKPSA